MRCKIDLINTIKISMPGILTGVISFPANYYLLTIKYRKEISSALGRPYCPTLVELLMLSIITTIFLIFCGILYILLYHKLPGEKAFTKAFTIGLIIYIISRIGDFIQDYPVSKGLFFDNALLSIPLILVLYPYLLSKLYPQNRKCLSYS